MSLNQILDDFDAAEADWASLAREAGVLKKAEAVVHDFLESNWPKIEPLAEQGIDFLALAAGQLSGPLAPLVGYIASNFGRVGLNYLVQWLARKTAS